MVGVTGAWTPVSPAAAQIFVKMGKDWAAAAQIFVKMGKDWESRLIIRHCHAHDAARGLATDIGLARADHAIIAGL